MAQAYEMMVLTKAEIEDTARTEIIDRAKQAVVKSGGSWEGVTDWGRRTMAYKINHIPDAWYSLCTFEGDGAAVDEAVRLLRISDGVIRVMAVHRVPENATMAELNTHEPEREERPRRSGRGGGGGGGRGPRMPRPDRD